MTDIEIEKIHAEISNLMAETANLNRDTKFMPWKVGAGVVATLVALGYIVLKFNALLTGINS